MKRVFRYRDRDDLVEIEVIPTARSGRFMWKATDAERVRALCPFPGFETEQEAWDDAVSLLNVVGE